MMNFLLLILSLFLTSSTCAELDQIEKRDFSGSLIQEITSLKERYDVQIDLISNLQRTLDTYVDLVTELQREQKYMTKTYGREISNLKEQISSLSRNQVNGTFSVYMTIGEFWPEPDEVIPFHGITANIGEHYDTTTHKYTCPTSGIYFFTFALYSGAIGADYPALTSGYLMLGHATGTQLAGLSNWVNEASTYVNLQGSNSVVTECSSGQQVWIQGSGMDNKIYGSMENKKTTFSGFMLATT